MSVHACARLRPAGSPAFRRWPRRLPPRNGVMLILTDVSSMKTRRRGWRQHCHSERTTLASARSFSDAISVILIAETLSAQELGQIGRISLHAMFGLKYCSKFRHGDVGPGFHLGDDEVATGTKLAEVRWTAHAGRRNRPLRFIACLKPYRRRGCSRKPDGSRSPTIIIFYLLSCLTVINLNQMCFLTFFPAFRKRTGLIVFPCLRIS